MKFDHIIFGLGMLAGAILTTAVLVATYPNKSKEKIPVYNYQLILQRGDAQIAIAVPIEDSQLPFFQQIGTNPPTLGKVSLERKPVTVEYNKP